MLHRCEIMGGFCTQKCPKTWKKKTNKWTKSGESRLFKDRPPLPSQRSTPSATQSHNIVKCAPIRPDTPSLGPRAAGSCAGVSVSSDLASPEPGDTCHRSRNGRASPRRCRRAITAAICSQERHSAEPLGWGYLPWQTVECEE